MEMDMDIVINGTRLILLIDTLMKMKTLYGRCRTYRVASLITSVETAETCIKIE